MKKLLLPLILVPLLNACGSSEPEIGPFTVSVSDVPSVVNENGSLTITYTVTNIKNSVNATFVSNNTQFPLTLSGTNTYTLTIPELDRDATTSLMLSVKDGDDANRVFNRTFTIKAVNASFSDTLAEIEGLMPLKDRLIDMPEETKMIASLNDVIKLVEELGVSANAPTYLPTRIDVIAAFNAIELAKYKNGTIGDSELAKQYDALLEALANHIALTKDLLNSRLATASVLLPSYVQAGDFSIDREKGVASFFVGNENYGAYVDGNWVYKDSYAFLKGLTENDCTL